MYIFSLTLRLLGQLQKTTKQHTNKRHGPLPVTVVPRAAVRLPGSQTHPAKVGLAVLVLAHHVIAAAVLLNRHVAPWTLFGVGRYPVTGLRIVVALLDPHLEQMTLDRIVPVLAAGEAERVIALAGDAVRLDVLHLDGHAAVRRRAPSQQTVALQHNR